LSVFIDLTDDHISPRIACMALFVSAAALDAIF
jgi:hypothetical protein